MLIEKLQQQLLIQSEKLLTRKRQVIIRPSTNTKACINFGSNDYLSLTKHPKIAEVLSKAVQKHGFGSGASALVCGYSEEHQETEHQFAEWLKVDEAILFSSGYLANLAVLDTLLTRSNVVYADKLCHASLLDGIRLSRAKLYRYRHCDLSHLCNLAAKKNPETNCDMKRDIKPDLIVTESIFSMEGDIAPIEGLVRFAKEQQAGLLIDDAHGIGVLGQQGAGVSEYHNIDQNQYTCLTLPLGKAFNAMGAIVAGRREVMEIILQFARSYRYSTALPPAFCKTIRTGLQLIREESWRRLSLSHNIRYFNQAAKNHGITVVSPHETPIRSILVPDTAKVLGIQSFLLSQGFYVPAIRPPTVPENMSRLRISLNCAHTESEMLRVIEHIAEKLHA